MTSSSLELSVIWVVYVVVVAILIAIASIFIYVYQTPRDRSPAVTIVCILTVTALFATILLQPVDIALVSSTVVSKLGHRKDWATQDEVDKITHSLTIVYYVLYALDALLCLLVIPFTYFWYEEYDEIAAEEGKQDILRRLWGSFKYTLAFAILTAILFIVGFFVPIPKKEEYGNELDYLKRFLTENHGERALTFALGILITLGILLYILYTSVGFAILPVSFIKTTPSISNPYLKANTATQLEANRQRQRQLECRCGGNTVNLSSKDRRELEALFREERTLIRRQRLLQAQGEGRGWMARVWVKLEALVRPFSPLCGVLLLSISLLVCISMLLTTIDKARNSVCKQHCGYILTNINVFNPVNFIFVQAARVFPIDYVLFALLVVLFFSSSVVGLATIGIRFLWVQIFQIRKGHTSPQALLMAAAMLMLIALALNYSLAMIVAPQYATFGPQTFCDRPTGSDEIPADCTDHRDYVKPCSELADNSSAKSVCTPSVVSTILNRITWAFPFVGGVVFWAQFVWLGMYLIVLLTTFFYTPRLNERQMDDDAEEAEEESLLGSTWRPFNAPWQDTRDTTNRRNA